MARSWIWQDSRCVLWILLWSYPDFYTANQKVPYIRHIMLFLNLVTRTVWLSIGKEPRFPFIATLHLTQSPGKVTLADLCCQKNDLFQKEQVCWAYQQQPTNRIWSNSHLSKAICGFLWTSSQTWQPEIQQFQRNVCNSWCFFYISGAFSSRLPEISDRQSSMSCPMVTR